MFIDLKLLEFYKISRNHDLNFGKGTNLEFGTPSVKCDFIKIVQQGGVAFECNKKFVSNVIRSLFC
jgi:hypothetical protein